MIKSRALRCVLALSASAALLGAGTASAASTTAGAQKGKSDGRFCVIEVSKSIDGGLSPVKSRMCSDDPASPAFRAAAAPNVLLMEWFKHAHNNPPNLTRIIASAEDGPCDSSGYRLRPALAWDNQISAFNAFSNCHEVTLYDGYNMNGDSEYWYNGAHDGPDVGYVGDWMNDRTSSLWIRS